MISYFTKVEVGCHCCTWHGNCPIRLGHISKVTNSSIIDKEIALGGGYITDPAVGSTVVKGGDASVHLVVNF